MTVPGPAHPQAPIGMRWWTGWRRNVSSAVTGDSGCMKGTSFVAEPRKGGEGGDYEMDHGTRRPATQSQTSRRGLCPRKRLSQVDITSSFPDTRRRVIAYAIRSMGSPRRIPPLPFRQCKAWKPNQGPEEDIWKESVALMFDE